MKILLINNLYGQYAKGGAERVVDGIAGELLRQKHEVMVISSRPLQISDLGFKILDLRTILFYPWNLISYYNLHKLPKFLRPLWHLINIFNLQSYFRIKKIIKQENSDIIMTHNLMGVGFLTPLVIKRAGIKHIHTLHDIQLLHPSGLMMVGEEKKVDGFFARLYQGITKKLFVSVDVVVSPSRWLLDEHLKRGFFENSKKMVLQNPAETQDPEDSDVDSGSRSAHAPLGRNDKFIFLYVGQIEKHKGVELLIQAFSELHRKNCELWIVGEGNRKSEIINHKSESITFLGKKNAQEVKELMQKANCLIVPSLCYENQPTVIIEAAQNGLPVIASGIGGIPEIVPEQCLFRAGDKESLLKKMRLVIDDKEVKGSRLKIKGLSVQEYVDKLLKL